MARVLLFNPAQFEYEIYPIGLMYLGTYLQEQGHEVKIMDRSMGHIPYGFIHSFRPEVVGLGGLTNDIEETYTYSDMFRNFRIYTVIGGHHATAMPQEAIKHSDCVITGDGELEFANAVLERPNGIIKSNPLENLDIVKVPNYDLVEADRYFCGRYRWYIASHSWVLYGDRVATVMTSRGCPYRCTFCYNSIRKTNIRYRNLDNVYSELELLKNKYKIDAINFLDDVFLLDKKRLSKIGSMLKELKLYWGCQGRANLVNDDLVEMVKGYGCAYLSFGFESMNDRILQLLKKGTTVEQNINAIETCRRHKMPFGGSWMVGNPTETMEETLNTIKYVVQCTDLSALGIMITVPYPATEMWDWAIQNNMIPHVVNWRDFQFQFGGKISMSTVPINILKAYVDWGRSEAFNHYEQYEPTRIKLVQNIKRDLLK